MHIIVIYLACFKKTRLKTKLSIISKVWLHNFPAISIPENVHMILIIMQTIYNFSIELWNLKYQRNSLQYGPVSNLMCKGSCNLNTPILLLEIFIFWPFQLSPLYFSNFFPGALISNMQKITWAKLSSWKIQLNKCTFILPTG